MIATYVHARIVGRYYFNSFQVLQNELARTETAWSGRKKKIKIGNAMQFDPQNQPKFKNYLIERIDKFLRSKPSNTCMYEYEESTIRYYLLMSTNVDLFIIHLYF